MPFTGEHHKFNYAPKQARERQFTDGEMTEHTSFGDRETARIIIREQSCLSPLEAGRLGAVCLCVITKSIIHK